MRPVIKVLAVKLISAQRLQLNESAMLCSEVSILK